MDGLIDKYVGDEIMALWNVPLAQKDHALLAVRCAYDLLNAAPQACADYVAVDEMPGRQLEGQVGGQVSASWG